MRNLIIPFALAAAIAVATTCTAGVAMSFADGSFAGGEAGTWMHNHVETPILTSLARFVLPGNPDPSSITLSPETRLAITVIRLTVSLLINAVRFVVLPLVRREQRQQRQTQAMDGCRSRLFRSLARPYLARPSAMLGKLRSAFSDRVRAFRGLVS